MRSHNFLSILALSLLASNATADALPRNVVLIMADDIGIECFGCYGGTSYKTPHIDKLAAEGLRFTHAYSQPLCTPTRLEIMTGLDNHRNWQYFGILPQGEKTFGHLMQGYGYRTCISGKWQLQSYDPPDWPGAEKRRGTGMHPKDAGFDSYSLFHSLHTEDKGSRYGNPSFLRDGKLHGPLKGKYGEDLAVEHLLDFMGKNKAEPMFIYYPMALPHWPMVPTPISEAWKDPARHLEESVDYFPDMVEYMDEIVGRVVAGIDDLGLREDTLILFYSDNGTDRRITSQFKGEAVRGGKNQTLQTGIRVPLIASWPGKIEPRVSDDLVESSDFVPTLAALSGKKLSSEWQTDGISFAPELLGKENPGKRDWAFFWYDPRPGWDKEKFSRSIFALNHDYKLFDDGRMFAIDGEGLKEEPLDSKKLPKKAEAAKRKLEKAIEKMMRPPFSPAAEIEVDAYGQPVN